MDIQRPNTSLREMCLAVALGCVTAIAFGITAILAAIQIARQP